MALVIRSTAAVLPCKVRKDNGRKVIVAVLRGSQGRRRKKALMQVSPIPDGHSALSLYLYLHHNGKGSI